MKIETIIKRNVADYFSVSEASVTRDTNFVKDLQADSIDRIDLLLDFEDQFGISIDDHDMENIETIGDVIDYVEKQK